MSGWTRREGERERGGRGGERQTHTHKKKTTRSPLSLFFSLSLSPHPHPPPLRVTASSALLSFVFVFGNSLRGVYESVVFLFLVHPFDVGDTITVGPGVASGGGEKCVVAEIALLTTTLRRLGDGATAAWPNATLAAAPLVNVSRSGPRSESMKVLVDAGAAVNRVDADRRTALRAACWAGHLQSVKILLEAGASLNQV